MAWKEGESGNPNGKEPGTLNKTTRQLKEWFAAFSWNNAEKMQKAFDNVLKDNPAEALRLWLQFSERVAPKLSSNSVDVTSGGERIPAPIIQLPNSGTLPETGGGVDAPDRQADN